MRRPDTNVGTILTIAPPRPVGVGLQSSLQRLERDIQIVHDLGGADHQHAPP